MLTVAREGCAETFQSEDGPFLNKTQIVNRDISVAVLCTYFQLGGDIFHKIPQSPRLALDAFTSTGIRGFRYLREVPQIDGVILNDLSMSVLEYTAAGVTHNGQQDRCAITCVDAAEICTAQLGRPLPGVVYMGSEISKIWNPEQMAFPPPLTKLPDFKVQIPSNAPSAPFYSFQLPGVIKSPPIFPPQPAFPAPQFSVIDLDPYGSASEFLESAIKGIKHGGILCVTCTDGPVLGGGNRDKGITRYGSTFPKQPYKHEFAVRVILRCINDAAVKHGCHIVPVLSVWIAFYLRCFVRIERRKPFQGIGQIGYVRQCVKCSNFHTEPFFNGLSQHINCTEEKVLENTVEVLNDTNNIEKNYQNKSDSDITNIESPNKSSTKVETTSIPKKRFQEANEELKRSPLSIDEHRDDEGIDIKDTLDNNDHISFTHEECNVCGGRGKLYGPIWLGKTHHPEFCQALLSVLTTVENTELSKEKKQKAYKDGNLNDSDIVNGSNSTFTASNNTDKEFDTNSKLINDDNEICNTITKNISSICSLNELKNNLSNNLSEINSDINPMSTDKSARCTDSNLQYSSYNHNTMGNISNINSSSPNNIGCVYIPDEISTLKSFNNQNRNINYNSIEQNSSVNKLYYDTKPIFCDIEYKNSLEDEQNIINSLHITNEDYIDNIKYQNIKNKNTENIAQISIDTTEDQCENISLINHTNLDNSKTIADNINEEHILTEARTNIEIAASSLCHLASLRVLLSYATAACREVEVDVPLSFAPDKITKFLKLAQQPSAAKIDAALYNLGYRCCRVHSSPKLLKVNISFPSLCTIFISASLGSSLLCTSLTFYWDRTEQTVSTEASTNRDLIRLTNLSCLDFTLRNEKQRSYFPSYKGLRWGPQKAVKLK